MIKLTESYIACALRAYFSIRKNCSVSALNIKTYHDYESDFIAINPRGFVHEVEIKLSLSDFKADFKKSRTKIGTYEENGQVKFSEREIPKHDSIKNGEYANHFWFAAPQGVIPIELVPDYSGLIEFSVREQRRARDLVIVHITKPAPKMHKNKSDKDFIYRLCFSMMHKAWDRQFTINNFGGYRLG